MNNLRYSAPIIVTIWTFILMSNTAFAQNTFRANLTGEAEVPPLFSESYGSALVFGNDSSLTYQINVTSLDNFTGASLYKGDTSENGQVLVSLLNSTEPSGVIDGKLVEGTINSSSIMAPLANLTTNVTLPYVESTVPAAGNLTNMTPAVPSGNLTNMTPAVPSGNLTNMTSAVPSGNLTNMTSAVPSGNLTNMTSAVPSGNLTNMTSAAGNLTNMTSAAGNLTNMTSAAGNLTNMTSAAAPATKLEALIDLMNQNMTYINIHTSKFPEGELRGTLTNSTG
jgi:CHRD domain